MALFRLPGPLRTFSLEASTYWNSLNAIVGGAEFGFSCSIGADFTTMPFSGANVFRELLVLPLLLIIGIGANLGWILLLIFD